MSLWFSLLLLLVGVTEAQLLGVTHPSDDTVVRVGIQTRSVVVDGCHYGVPWQAVVLPLTPDCLFQVPECGVKPQTGVQFTLASLEDGDELWRMTWGSSHVFTGTRVQNGLWLELDGAVQVLEAVPPNTLVTFRLEWPDTHTLTVSHSYDNWGAVVLPFNMSSAQAQDTSSCVLGPTRTELYAVVLDGTRVIQHWDLLRYVDNPLRCFTPSVTLPPLPLPHSRWTLERNNTEALLTLSPWDRSRCRGMQEWAAPLEVFQTEVCTVGTQKECQRFQVHNDAVHRIRMGDRPADSAGARDQSSGLGVGSVHGGLVSLL